MDTPRISASSYSNTAPLVWSFLYGSNHGKVEMILDNAPARSAELLSQGRVDAALVPVIASQFIPDVKLIRNVCVGAKEHVRSVRLVTNGSDLERVRSVSLDTSSRTSVVLTKIIFREFLGFEPEWRPAAPDIDEMLSVSDAALIIGDPALSISEGQRANAGSGMRSFDLAALWRRYSGLGFVFAMWMTTRENCVIDFQSARDEGLEHLEEIAANYAPHTGLSIPTLVDYLSNHISYSIDPSMQQGLELYLDLAFKHKLTERKPELRLI